MKMKLKDVLEIMAELKRMENVESSVEFSYAAMKNFSVGEPETEIVKKIAMQSVDGAEEYRTERQKIIEKYVEKDDKGNIKTQRQADGQNHYIFVDDNQSKFLKEIDELNKTFSDYIKNVEERQDKINKLVEKEIDVNFIKVKLSQFPNKISPRQMKVLSPMIDEEEK